MSDSIPDPSALQLHQQRTLLTDSQLSHGVPLLKDADGRLFDLILEAAGRVVVRGLLAKTKITLVYVAVPLQKPEAIRLMFDWTIPDRIDGTDKSFTYVHQLRQPHLDSWRQDGHLWRHDTQLDWLESEIRIALRTMWIHELCESLWDGSAEFDPHKPNFMDPTCQLIDTEPDSR